MVLHFDFFSASNGPEFDFVEGERKEKGDGGGFPFGEKRGGFGFGGDEPARRQQ